MSGIGPSPHAPGQIAGASAPAAPPTPAWSFPFALQIGGVGFGIGIGCGAGIGFGQPVSLASVPMLGQAAAGMSAGLARAGGLLGGLGSRCAGRGASAAGL